MRSVTVMLIAALVGGCGSSQPAAEGTVTPTALVTTIAPERGSLPRLIEAYGTATPAANGVVTLSVAQPGQVVAVSVVAGARVAAGQPIVAFALAPSARGAYLQAAYAVTAAEAQRRTTQQLLGDQLATRDQLVQAEKAAADARTTLAALASEGAGSARTTLRAPFAGIVATLPVAPGDRTQAGQALATIARAGAVIVTVGVDPARRDVLATGAPVELRRVDGATDAPVAGRVLRVDAMLNPRTHQIDVDIAYRAGALLPGEAVRAGIRIGTASGWIVPHRAVVIDADGGAQVFQVVGGKAKSVRVAIEVGGADQDCVTGPIDGGAALIVDGAYQVGDGDAVRIARGHGTAQLGPAR